MNDQGGVITNKIFRLRFRLRMEFMLNFNLRNGDYQNPEIVSYSGHSLKLNNLEIGLYPTQELYLR